MRAFLITIFAFVLAACGQAANPTSADAQPASNAASAPAAGAVSSADKTAITHALQMSADAHGLVMNECGDKVEPQYLRADVGLGETVLFVMTGGPNGGYSCYGDGPGLWLMRRQGAAWQAIYTTRGGSMIILPTKHNGANDLAFGGPGTSHATSRWTGSAYGAGPDIADDALPTNAQILPAN